MKYTLKRCPLTRNGTLFKEIVFDLWNDEFQTGYEIKVTLCNMYPGRIELELMAYLNLLLGRTYDISRWDKIIRDIKQKKIEGWVIYK